MNAFQKNVHWMIIVIQLNLLCVFTLDLKETDLINQMIT
jgi:hypothetical protein